MNLTSQKLMTNFSKKAGNLLALTLAAISCQAAIPVGLLLTSSALITAEAAYAEESMMVTMVQTFGWDYSNGHYKALIQTPSGHQFFVWYPTEFDVRVGSVVKATYTGGSYLYFNTLTNIGNGKQARISRYIKAN
jgi:surface antigen